VAKKMIAVIHTGGKQYLVSPGQKIKIEKLETEVGKKVDFEKVLLFEDEKGNLSLGTPFLKDVKVTGKVLETGLGEKVRVFKYKPKTRYKIKKGHRQPYTEVEIEKITTK
jgi:large subunit ribosomal protein L21